MRLTLTTIPWTIYSLEPDGRETYLGVVDGINEHDAMVQARLLRPEEDPKAFRVRPWRKEE